MIVEQANPAQSDAFTRFDRESRFQQIVAWGLGKTAQTYVNGPRVRKVQPDDSDHLQQFSDDSPMHYERNPRRYLFGVRS